MREDKNIPQPYTVKWNASTLDWNMAMEVEGIFPPVEEQPLDLTEANAAIARIMAL